MSRMTRREASCQVWKRTTEVDCGARLCGRGLVLFWGPGTELGLVLFYWRGARRPVI